MYSIRILKDFFCKKIWCIQSRFLNNRNKSYGIQSRLLGFCKEFNKICWYSIKFFYNLKKVLWYSKVYRSMDSFLKWISWDFLVENTHQTTSIKPLRFREIFFLSFFSYQLTCFSPSYIISCLFVESDKHS